MPFVPCGSESLDHWRKTAAIRDKCRAGVNMAPFCMDIIGLIFAKINGVRNIWLGENVELSIHSLPLDVQWMKSVDKLADECSQESCRRWRICKLGAQHAKRGRERTWKFSNTVLSVGLGRTRRDATQHAEAVVREKGTFKEQSTHEWENCFLQGQGDLSLRRGEITANIYTKGCNQQGENINHYFSLLKDIL